MSKKTFAGNLAAAFNPAEAFISAPSTAPAGGSEAQAPVDPAAAEPPARAGGSVETKSQRVQLLMKPSLVAWLKARARATGGSMNDLINQLVEQAKGAQKE